MFFLMEQVFISQPQEHLKIEFGFDHKVAESSLCGKMQDRNFEGILGLRDFIYLIKTITIEKQEI